MKTPRDQREKSFPRTDVADLSRRRFLAKSGGVAGAAAAGFAFPSVTFGAPDKRKLKVGLIGCGGRGTGAANQALMADSNTVVSALADAFPDPIEKSLQSLVKYQGERIDVPPSRQFVGMDAFEKLLETDVDVVLLATPPGFRPMHYRACIEAGKHVFAEKPVAVDAPGVRSVMETNKLAEEKGLSVLSGRAGGFRGPVRSTGTSTTTSADFLNTRAGEGCISAAGTRRIARISPGISSWGQRDSAI